MKVKTEEGIFSFKITLVNIRNLFSYSSFKYSVTEKDSAHVTYPKVIFIYDDLLSYDEVGRKDCNQRYWLHLVILVLIY